MQAHKPQPIRAVWIDTWGEGLYDREQCDAMLDWCAQAGINTLLVEVRKVADAYHVSALEPRGRNEQTKQPIADNFDPLAYVLKRARHDNLRVEAWIVANRVWVGLEPPPPSDPPHIMLTNPEWLLRNQDGAYHDGSARPSIYIDPSDPEARAHTARVAAEIVRRYRVDAVHLDYIRYPGNTWGYGERSLARFWDESGRSDIPEPTDPMFLRWRAAQVTRLVRDIREAMQETRRGVELTAATVTWGAPDPEGYHNTAGFQRAMQDWPAWMDSGLLDLVYIMHYKREYDAMQAADYRAWFPWMKIHQDAGRGDVVIGQGSYMNDIPDSVEQLRDALDTGFAGVCLFSYRTTNRGGVDRDGMAQALRQGLGWASPAQPSR